MFTTITIYPDEHGEGQKFIVHESDAEGNTIDVTEAYEVRALALQDEVGMVAGYHIGRRLAPDDVLSIADELGRDPSTGKEL